MEIVNVAQGVPEGLQAAAMAETELYDNPPLLNLYVLRESSKMILEVPELKVR
jgi:hypothetical protein